MHIVKFKKRNCELQFGKYENGRTAIELVEIETGDPIVVATVNVPEIELEVDEVIIKNYSENSGILQTLILNSIISEPIASYGNGFVNVPVCKLLVKPE